MASRHAARLVESSVETLMNQDEVSRVIATAAAIELIEKLKSEHGQILFHQSGGCCDGSAPMCFPVAEFTVGSSDVKLGEIGGVAFYMSDSQFTYWQNTQLTIDCVPGSGGMFSLEGSSGLRFITRSRLFDDTESAWLGRHPVEHVTG
jgi:uncharacterized protein